jgi:pimeloyl-ACP methyl ester carboxylesterase
MLPDARFVGLKGCSHHIPVEKPDEVFQAMDEFLCGLVD